MSKKHRYESRQEAARREARSRRIKRIGVIAAGLVLVAGLAGGYYLTGGGIASAESSLSEADIVRDSPFRAIHEMKKGPPIPFLPADAPQPRIVVPERVYDFGTVGPQDVVEYTFVIRNEGEAPLTISRAFTTCGCTTAQVSARVIPPGKAARVTLRFDAGFHDVRGQEVKRGLVIESNDRRRWKTTVWTRAKVRRS